MKGIALSVLVVSFIMLSTVIALASFMPTQKDYLPVAELILKGL